MKKAQTIENMNSFLKKWKKDYFFKTIASSMMSFVITMIFALYNGFLGIHLLSVWHGSICVFYLFLVIIRGMILLTEKRNIVQNEHEKAHCRQKMFIITAFILLALNLALIAPISLMVVLKKPVHMGLIPAIAMAAYTTYKITIASIHIKRQKRTSTGNILVSELRIINFIDALVSILTLQNTLITVNQTQEQQSDMLVLSSVSSAVIYAVIVSISIYILVKGLKYKSKIDRAVINDIK